MGQPDELAIAVTAALRSVHRRVFLGDPAANDRLFVEVVDARLVTGVPVLVVVTPWTIAGLMFCDDIGETVELAGRRRPVFRMDLPGLPPFQSIVLPPQPAALRSMRQARTLALSWAEPLQTAVRAARVPA